MDTTSSCQRHLFEFSRDDTTFDGSQSEIIYLDAAGKTPLLRTSADAGRVAVGYKSRPWLMAGQENHAC